jgi:uncharacterized protein
MKYLLVLLVVGIGLWSLLARWRGRRQDGAAKGGPAPGKAPVQVVQCAHCGLHLPAADAVPEGSRLYCSEAHRRLGPAQPPQA